MSFAIQIVVLGNPKFFLPFDYQVDISLYLMEVATLLIVGN